MEKIKLEAIINFESSNCTGEEAMKILEHHIEYLFDLSSWPEIKSVQGVYISKEE